MQAYDRVGFLTFVINSAPKSFLPYFCFMFTMSAGTMPKRKRRKRKTKSEEKSEETKSEEVSHVQCCAI